MAKNRFMTMALWFIVFVCFLSGCAGKVRNMQVVSPERAAITPEEGKAVVVFMRPSKSSHMLQSSIFEVKDNDLSIVGIVAARAKVAYSLSPGKHLFMVVGEDADFMSADLLPNKTYYALVTPSAGTGRPHFSLEPVHKDRLNSSEFSKWLDACRLVEKTPGSDSWATGNMPSVKLKQAEYYQKWMSKSEAERPILLPGDGM